jgi:hypothetical protein
MVYGNISTIVFIDGLFEYGQKSTHCHTNNTSSDTLSHHSVNAYAHFQQPMPVQYVVL